MRARRYRLRKLMPRKAYPWREEEATVGECDVALRLRTLAC